MKSRVRPLVRTIDRLVMVGLSVHRPAVLRSLRSGILIGQMERDGLTGQDCAFKNAKTCINITYG